MPREYQQSIALNTLYECIGSGSGDGSSLQPYIEIVGGTANIYGCVERPNNPPDDMSLGFPTAVQGIIPFDTIPNFLFIEEASGSITSIILSGVEATETTTA